MEVVINGNVLSLQGDASEEHMLKVAKIINEKLSEIHKAYDKSHLPASKLSQLLTLNLADEYVNKQELLEEYLLQLNALKNENEKLAETVGRLAAELAKTKEALSAEIEQKKHTTHTNRGR